MTVLPQYIIDAIVHEMKKNNTTLDKTMRITKREYYETTNIRTILDRTGYNIHDLLFHYTDDSDGTVEYFITIHITWT